MAIFLKGKFSYIHLTKKRCETVPTVGSLGAVFGRSFGCRQGLAKLASVLEPRTLTISVNMKLWFSWALDGP